MRERASPLLVFSACPKCPFFQKPGEATEANLVDVVLNNLALLADNLVSASVRRVMHVVPQHQGDDRGEQYGMTKVG